MHNLHLVTINAETPQEACDSVESEIETFGNENNCRSICGCVSEDNEVYIANDDWGRYPPDKNMTITDVEKMVNNWVSRFPYDITEILIKFHLNEESLTSMDWVMFRQYCGFKSEQLDFQQTPFHIWTSEFRSWQLDECGLTNLIDNDSHEKKYVVFVDMHS
jgi:hypothetical protein